MCLFAFETTKAGERAAAILNHTCEVLSSLHQFPIAIDEVAQMACALTIEENVECWRMVSWATATDGSFRLRATPLFGVCLLALGLTGGIPQFRR
jgi:hypothetical protein